MNPTLRQYLDGGRGRLARLADALGVSPPAILQWGRIPAERTLPVEKATGISRHDLRPDLFGPPPKKMRRVA